LKGLLCWSIQSY